jgi:eukaryotic-like serine/threonine-protein kinase
MIGQQIENYRILELLGVGGMGQVWKALDVNLKRMVALKVINAEFSDNRELMERFIVEARVQAALNHPNIATLFTFFIWQGKAVMVMEFVDGKTLRDMVTDNGALEPQFAIDLCKQALLGVDAAHRMGVVHRDIKPANLMLNTVGTVKVMDFGIAKIQDGNHLTRTHTAIGTYCYMAPEQIEGEPVDARTDIYSMGVTLYELLTGRVPFDFASDFAIQNAHVKIVPTSPMVHNPKIPKALAAVVMRALEKKPADRFQNAKEFINAFPDLSDLPPEPVDERRTRDSGRSTVWEQHTGRASDGDSTGRRTAYQETSDLREREVKPATRGRRKNNGVLVGAVCMAVIIMALGVGWFVLKPDPFADKSNRESKDSSLGNNANTNAGNGGSNKTGGEVKSDTPKTSDMGGTADDSKNSTPKGPNAGGDSDTDKHEISELKKPPKEPEKKNDSSVIVPPPPPVLEGPLSGSWSGSYTDGQNKQTNVEMTLHETDSASGGQKDVSGVMSFVTPDNTSGKCSVQGSGYDPQSRQLKLLITGCSKGQTPAFFNAPTMFRDVSPTATVLSKGHVYGQAVTASLYRKQ